MKTLEQIRENLWFPTPDGTTKRLNETDWDALRAALESGGWVIVPMEASHRQIEAGAAAGASRSLATIYKAMIQTRQR